MSSQTPPPFKPTVPQSYLDAAPQDPSTESKGDLSPFEQKMFNRIMKVDQSNVEASNRPHSKAGEFLGMSRGVEEFIGLGAASAREGAASFLQTNFNLFAGATDLGRQLWNEAVLQNPMLTLDDPVMAPDAKAMFQAGYEVMKDPSVALNYDELTRRATEHTLAMEEQISRVEAGDRFLIGLRQSASAAGGLFAYVGGAPGAIMRASGSAIGRTGATVLGRVAVNGLKRMGYSGAKITEIARNGQLWAEYVSAASSSPRVRFALEKLEKWGLPIAAGAGGFASVSFIEGGASPGQTPKDLRGRTGDAAVSAILSVGFVMAGGLANVVENKVFRALTSKKVKADLGKQWTEKQLRGGLKGRAEASRAPGMKETLDMDMANASAEVRKWLQGRAKWNARISGTIGGFIEGMGFQAADMHFYKELIPAIYQGDQDKIDEALANMIGPSIGTSLGMAFLRGRAPSQSAAWRKQFPEENMISNVVAADMAELGKQSEAKPGEKPAEKPTEKPGEAPKGDGTTALATIGPKPETLESADMLHRSGWVYRGVLIDANEGGAGAPSDTMQFGVQSVPGSMQIRHGADGMSIEVDPGLVKYVTGAESGEALRLHGNDATEFYSRAVFKTTRDAIEARIFLLNSPLAELGLNELGPNEWHTADSTLRFTYRDGEVYQQDIREGISSAEPWRKVDGFKKKAQDKSEQRKPVVEIHRGWLKHIISADRRHGGDPYVTDAIETLRMAIALPLYAEAGDPNAQEIFSVMSDQSIHALVGQVIQSGDRASLLDLIHEISLVASGDSNAQFLQQELARKMQAPVVPLGRPEAGGTGVPEESEPIEVGWPGQSPDEVITPESKEQKLLGELPPYERSKDVETAGRKGAEINRRKARRQSILGGNEDFYSTRKEGPGVIKGDGPVEQRQLPAPAEETKLLRGLSPEAQLEMRAQAETLRTSRNWTKQSGPQRWRAAGQYAALMEQSGEELTNSELSRDFNISRPKAKGILEDVREQLKSVRAEATESMEASRPEPKQGEEEIAQGEEPKHWIDEEPETEADALIQNFVKDSIEEEKARKQENSPDDFTGPEKFLVERHYRLLDLREKDRENQEDLARYRRRKAQLADYKIAGITGDKIEKMHPGTTEEGLKKLVREATGIVKKSTLSARRLKKVERELNRDLDALKKPGLAQAIRDKAESDWDENQMKAEEAAMVGGEALMNDAKRPGSQKKNKEVESHFEGAKESDFPKEAVREVVNEQGKKLKVGYVVKELDDIDISHDPKTFIENKAYDQDFQGRNRGNVTLRESVNYISKTLDEERLMPERVMSSGAPIVLQRNKEGSKRLMGYSGNGRLMSIDLAYAAKKGRGEAYRKRVEKEAKALNLSMDEGMEKPVLVGVVIGEHERGKLIGIAKDANAGQTNEMTAAEKARSDAGRIDLPLMQTFRPSEKGDVTAASNTDFVYEFLMKIPKTERTPLTGNKGSLTKKGRERIKNAVFFKAWDDMDLAESIMDDEMSGVRRMGAALLGSSAKVIAFDAKIEAGVEKDLGLKGEILEAVKYVAHMKRSKETWEYHYGHEDPFGVRPQGAQKIIMKALWDYYASGARMQEYIEGTFEAAESGWGEGETDLFGNEIPPPNIEEVALAPRELIDAELAKQKAKKAKKGEGAALPGGTSESGQPTQRGNPEETREFGPETGAVRNPFPSLLDSLERGVESIFYLNRKNKQRLKDLPSDKRLFTDVKNWANWVGKRHVNWMRGLRGEESSQLAFESEQIDMRAWDLIGDWHGDFGSMAHDFKMAEKRAKLGAEKRDELHKDLGEFINARFGDDKRTSERIALEAMGEKPETPEEHRVHQLETFRKKWGNDLADSARSAQLDIADILNDGLDRLYELGETRKVGNQWLPVKGSDKPLGQVLNAKGAKAVRAAHRDDTSDPALREMVSYLMDTQPGRYPSEKLTIESIKDFHNEEDDGKDKIRGSNPYFRQSRIELPSEFLEMDPFLIVPHLLTKNAYYVAAVEKWGTGLKGLELLIQEIAKLNPKEEKSIREFYQSYFGYLKKKLGEEASGILGQYVTMSKLGFNFTGALRNAGQRYVNVAPWVSAATLIESTIEYPPMISMFTKKGREAELTYTRSGAVKAETALTAVDSDYGTINWMVRHSLKPFTRMEKENQTFTSIAVAKEFTKDMHRLIRYKKGDLGAIGKVLDVVKWAAKSENVPNQIRSKWEDVTKGHVDQNEIDNAIRTVLEYGTVPTATLKKITSYLTSSSQFGISMSTQRNWYPRHPLMRNLPLKFMVFSADMTGLVRDHFKTMFNWALRKQAYGNPWPMIKMILAGAMIGAITLAIKDWLLGTDESAITKQIKDGNLSDIDGTMLRLAQNASSTGLFFPFSDLVYDHSAIGTFSSTLENISEVSIAVAQNPGDMTNTFLALKKAANKEYPAIRQLRAAVQHVKAGVLSYTESDYPTELRQRNEMMQWRSASRDWREMDKHPGITGFTKVYLDRTLGNVPHYTINEKTLRYRYAREDIAFNSLGEASNKIASILEAAKNNPDPNAMRQAITSIRGSLEGGGPGGLIAQRDKDRFRKSIYDASPARLQQFDELQAIWIRRVDRVMDMAQKKAGTRISEGSRFSARASRALGAISFEPLIDVAIEQGPEGMKKRLQRPYELFTDAATRSPEILPEAFRKAWERRGRPEPMLWQHFYRSRVVPRLRKAQKVKLLRQR